MFFRMLIDANRVGLNDVKSQNGLTSVQERREIKDKEERLLMHVIKNITHVSVALRT